MKKNAIFLFALFLIPLIGFSQVNIQLGNPYPVIDASFKYYLKRADKSTMLAVKVDGKHLHMQALNVADLKLIKKNTYEDMPDGYVLEEIMYFNNRCYLFFSVWDRGGKTEQLFYREIDYSNAAFIGVEKLLFAEPGKISGALSNSGFYNFSVTDKFDFYTSYDSSKMIIQYRMKPEEARDAISKDVIGMRVYGKNLEPIWGELVQMPYTEKKMNNLDYSVDSEGNAYILSTVFNDNTTDIRKGKDEEANYHIELLRVSATTRKIEITPVDIGDKFINTVWLYEGPQNFMYCAGFYNKGKNLNNADGIFMFKVGKKGGIYDIKAYEIPVDVLNQYVSARTQKKNEKKDDKDKAEFENLKLKELIFEKDGSIILVGEQHFITQHTVTTSSGSRTTYVYHFNDILVTKITSAGNLGWMKKLPKRQAAQSSSYMPKYKGGMSYSLVNGTDGYYILFLDNAKNINLALDEIPAGHADGMGGFLTSYKINSSTGQISRVSIFDVKDVDGIPVYQFSVDRILQVSENEFVVEAYKKQKEDILIKVKLPE